MPGDTGEPLSDKGTGNMLLAWNDFQMTVVGRHNRLENKSLQAEREAERKLEQLSKENNFYLVAKR